MAKLKNYILDFLNYLNFEKNYSQNTINAYNGDLNEMKTYLDSYNGETELNQIDRSALQFFLSHISQKKISARTLSRKIATIKSFFKYMVEQEILDKNITKGISFPKVPKKLPSFLTEKEIEKLMEIPEFHSKNPIRDILILELLYSSGMRINELVSIKMDDIRLEEGLIKVVGKGNAERDVLVGSFAKESLKKYLNNRKSNQSKFLFPAEHKNSKTGHVSVRKTYGDIKKYLLLATGNDALSPHSIRHTTATRILNYSKDITKVQAALGHADLRSAERYAKVDFEELRAAMERRNTKS